MLPWQATHNPEYRTAKAYRVFIYLLIPPLILLFLALPFLVMQGKNPFWGGAVFFGLVGFGMAGFMVYGLLDTVKGCFTIGTRKVSQVGVFKTKTLALNEILGYRIDSQYTRIYPKENYLPTIKIGYTTERYQEIGYWLAGHYPDLDQVETQQATTMLLADDALGDTTEARAGALATARKVAMILNVAGGAAGLWLFFYPRPYNVAIAVGLLLPWLAVVALWLRPNTLRIDEQKNSGYPALVIAFIGPSFGLVLRALFDYEVVSYAPLWPVVGATAAGVAVALVIGSRKFLFRAGATASVSFTIALLAFLYGYGATSIVNAVYDEGPTTTFTPQVTGKHISTGKTTTYYLTLKAWGPVATDDDVSVSRACYQQVQPGQPITVALRPGRLGVPWFAVVEE